MLHGYRQRHGYGIGTDTIDRAGLFTYRRFVQREQETREICESGCRSGVEAEIEVEVGVEVTRSALT